MGDQPENSAIDALLRTITPIANSISKKKTTNQYPTWPAVLTHDIEGAFNQVRPVTLEEIMHQRGIPLYLTKWVAAFNTARKWHLDLISNLNCHNLTNVAYHRGHQSCQSSFLYTVMRCSKMMKTFPTLSTPPMRTMSVWFSCHGQYLKPTHTLKNEPNDTWQKVYSLDSPLRHPRLNFSTASPLLVRMKARVFHHIRPFECPVPQSLRDDKLNTSEFFIDESLTFKHHAAMAAARGNKVHGSLNFLRHQSCGMPVYIAHHLAMIAILPAMFWVSPAWWAATPGVITALRAIYNTIARWITGFPLNTRTTNLITLAHLPPMEAYLDYVSLRYAIRLHFLPTHDALGPPHDQPNTHASLPGLHRLYSLSKHLVLGKLEDRTSTTTMKGVATTASPNPDKTTKPQQLHEKWIQTLPDHTIMIYTDGFKLANGAVG